MTGGGYGAVPPNAPYQGGYPPAGAYHQGYDPSKEHTGYNQPGYAQGGQPGYPGQPGYQQQYGVIVQQQPATQVVLVGGCPACRVNVVIVNHSMYSQTLFSRNCQNIFSFFLRYARSVRIWGTSINLRLKCFKTIGWDFILAHFNISMVKEIIMKFMLKMLKFDCILPVYPPVPC